MAALWHELPRFLTYYTGVFLLTALFNTLLLSVVGCLVGGILGLGLAIVRTSRARAMAVPRLCAWGFAEFFRRLPPLVVLMLAFFGAALAGLKLSLLVVALIGLSLVATASLAEIIRGGIASVNPTQWDAASALNFGFLRCILTVILPQARHVILSPALSFLLLFIKDTAFASQLGTLELTYAGKLLTTRGFSAFLSYGSVLLLYFGLSWALSWVVCRVDRRMGVRTDHS